MKNKTGLLLLTVSLLLSSCTGRKCLDPIMNDGEGRAVEPRPTQVSHEEIPSVPENRMANAWEPNEGDLVRAGDLVMDLRRELKRPPTSTEMQSHLQTHMNLSSEQAYRILDELGLV